MSFSFRSAIRNVCRYAAAAGIGLATLSFLLWGLTEKSQSVESNGLFARSELSDVSRSDEAMPPRIATSNASDVGSLRDTLQIAHQRHVDQLRAQELTSAGPADWLTVCRRLSLAMVGSGMSVQEIRNLQAEPVSARANLHLENLLRDSRFHHYWAIRWERLLVGNDEGEFVTFRRRRFRTWLTSVFERNMPYDDLVRKLVTADGLWTDHPQVNFLSATFDSNGSQPDPVRLAARTSRVFLGLRIDCLQCHDDFLGNVSLGNAEDPRSGLQSDFHQLAAFYTAAENNGLQGIKTVPVDYRYKYLDATEELSIEPAVPYQPELLPPRRELNDDARRRLADWLTHPENRQAARAAVSHVWALMFGKPDGAGVDDLPLDQPDGVVMECFVDDFAANDFNIRRLIRLIAASDPFTVNSRAEHELTARHEATGGAFPLVRLRPEQVAGAIGQAARIKTVDRESSFLIQMIALGTESDFVNRFGDLGEDELLPQSVTITQRLLMMNGKLTREALASNPILNATSHIKMFAGDTAEQIEVAYLAVLNRYPTETEAAHFETLFRESENRDLAMEDLMWVLVNSSEFAWNH